MERRIAGDDRAAELPGFQPLDQTGPHRIVQHVTAGLGEGILPPLFRPQNPVVGLGLELRRDQRLLYVVSYNERL